MHKLYNKIKSILYGIYSYLHFCGGGFFFKIEQNKTPKGNIILIPGIMHNSLTMRPMGSFFNKLGYNIYLPKIGWNVWDVDTQTKKVNQFWKKLTIDKSLPLFIVGHSMGGLIAHYWVKNYKIKPKKLITLGTPFLGSNAIYWGPWYFLPAAKWIKPQKKLPDYIIKAKHFTQINIVTSDDNLVTINSGLPKKIDSQKIVLKNYGGHSGLEIGKKTFEKIYSLIN